MAQRRTTELTFAECRSLGHEWRKGPVLGVDDEHPAFRTPFGGRTAMVGIPSTCANCGTEKVRWISRSGESFTRYLHPDGYSRHGDEVLTAREWREDYVSTLFTQFEQRAATHTTTPRRNRKAAA